MKKKLSILLMSILILTCLNGISAGEVDIDGAVPGKWTMDFDAAKKVAKEKKLPIILNFTGSDWCGWCKIMDKNIFAKDDWKKYSKENVLMVYIDFPKNKKLVPTKYVSRNDALKIKFGISGYPTYIVLDDNGETVLGKTGAGKEKTPTTFIDEITSICQYTDANIQKYLKTLKPKDQKTYLAIVTKLNKNSDEKAAHTKEISNLEKKVVTLSKDIAETQEKAQDFRATQKGPEALKKYKLAKTNLTKAKLELENWLKSKPQRSQENMTKFQALNAQIMSLKKILSDY